MASYDNKLINGKALKAAKDAIDGKADIQHSHSVATSSAAGMMSSTDKSKLDGFVVATVAEIEEAISAHTAAAGE